MEQVECVADGVEGLQHSWADFLEIALPRAVQLAFDENEEFRQSLPRGEYFILYLFLYDLYVETNRIDVTNIVICLYSQSFQVESYMHV